MSTSIEISGKVHFAGVDFDVFSKYSGTEGGLVFNGQIDDGQKINLSSFVIDLFKQFNVTLPSESPEVDLYNLSVSINTTSKSFSFGAELVASEKVTSGIDLKNVTGKVAIGSKIDSDTKKRTITGSVEGKLVIGKSTFTLRYTIGTTENKFLAHWKERGGEELGIHDFAKLFGLEISVPESLDLKLNDAVFEYDFKEGKLILTATSKTYGRAFFVSMNDDDKNRGYVFGLGNEEIDLTNLPIIRGEFKSKECIKLRECKIIASSSSFKDFVIPKPPTNNPISIYVDKPDSSQKLQLQKGIFLGGIMDFMDYTQEIDLQLGIDTTNFDMNLIADSPEKTNGKTKWISVQRTYGPVQFKRIGLGLQGSKVVFLLDAGLSAAGLTIDLEGLSLSISLKNLTDFRIGLQGLGIAFKGGPVEISGGFLKTDNSEYNEYNGMALVRVSSYSLSAMGSYAERKNDDGIKETSLFIFGMISAPMGGPPYFYLAGVALGFGYNRGLKIPGADRIREFPLVAGVLGEGGISSESKPGEVLKEMSEYIYPSIGNYWFAAGIQFSSFETIKAFVLVSVLFGTSFEVSLIGIASIGVPTKVPYPVFYAEMALVANFAPQSGLIGVSAALTPASYILSKDCKLTGGFAFYTWFAGEHEGDFVVTLGGYHKDFKKPSHYPTTMRLGLNWRISDVLQIKGGGYFAITPSCLMAGGELDATFHKGNLKAWFTVHANFLMSWNPLHYDITVAISIGVFCKVKFLGVHKTVSTELDASVHLWGPEFAGEAKIHWYIISFTISFGDAKNSKPEPLTWNQFSKSFLPHPEKKNKNVCNSSEDKLIACNVRIAKGLLKEVKDSDQVTRWIIKPEHFMLISHSVLPSTSIYVNGNSISLEHTNTELGILPMGEKYTLDSIHSIIIEKQTYDQSWIQIPQDHLHYSVITENVPEALWGRSIVTTPRAETIKNVPVGIVLIPKPIDYHSIPDMDISVLKFTPINHEFSWGNVEASTKPQFPQEDQIKTLMNTIMDSERVNVRQDILNALVENDLNVRTDINLELMAKKGNNIFEAPLMLATLGGVKIG
ncbi:MAG: hypothetical protein KAX49_08095 [Halanaerobiales bacterium]|nr:hypothetical protein [Halanaerobiales bacterium]